MNYYLHILVFLQIYILLAVSANQMIGKSGLLNLSHAVFYGIGAYTTAIATTKYGFSFFASWYLLVPITLIASFIYSYIGTKVRKLYFSVATIALQIIFFSLALNWVGLTSGPYGIPGIESPQIGNIIFNDPLSFFLLISATLFLVLIALFYLSKSRLQLLIEATKDDEIAFQNLGLNPNKYRFASIFISSIIASFAGSLYAGYTTYIDPSAFNLDESILILSIVLIGGTGSIRGVILGAIIYVLLPEILKAIDISDSYAANLRMILFGLILIGIVRFRPQGLLGKSMQL